MSLQGEGPSCQKGKTIDPQEWGGLHLDPKEVDMEAQAAVLESFKLSKEGHNKTIKKHLRHQKASPKL